MPRLTISVCKESSYKGDGKSRWVIWDDEIKGFGLRVYPSGRKSFVLSYRIGGRKRLFTIGDFGVWTTDQARKEARKLLVDIEHGTDPKVARITASQQGVTFSDMKTAYETKHVPTKKSGHQDVATLKRYIPNSWLNKELASFQRIDVAKLHQAVGEKNGPYAANRLLALVRKMFNFAVENGFLPDGHPNPGIGIKAYPEKKRERFVMPSELPKVWAAIQAEKDEYWRAYFSLCLLLGARRSEIISMKWSDVYVEEKVWVIPDTKAGRGHTLPLPSAVIEILNSIPRLAGSPYVFPSHGKTGHLVEPKSAWARIRERAGLADLRIHDLRRTVGSWLAAQGESLTMIGKVLNHSQPSTTAIYARLHLDPVRAAMDRNVDQMLTIIADKENNAENVKKE
jgi:integrase